MLLPFDTLAVLVSIDRW